MPKKLMRCVKHIKAKNVGKPKSKQVDPWAACIKSTGQKPHRKGKK